MTQYVQNQYKSGNYTLAGDQLHPFERIVVAATVDVPDEAVQMRRSPAWHISRQSGGNETVGISRLGRSC